MYISHWLLADVRDIVMDRDVLFSILSAYPYENQALDRYVDKLVNHPKSSEFSSLSCLIKNARDRMQMIYILFTSQDLKTFAIKFFQTCYGLRYSHDAKLVLWNVCEHWTWVIQSKALFDILKSLPHNHPKNHIYTLVLLLQ